MRRNAVDRHAQRSGQLRMGVDPSSPAVASLGAQFTAKARLFEIVVPALVNDMLITCMVMTSRLAAPMVRFLGG